MQLNTAKRASFDEGSLDQYLREISQYPLITREEEVTLAQRIKRGDEEALDKLVRSNLRFVVSVAKKYQNQGVSLSDLINEGNLGLIRAAHKFDETKGIKFISYAVWWIRQAILQALFFFQAEDGIRVLIVTGVQTCALPISWQRPLDLDPVDLRALADAQHHARVVRGQITSRSRLEVRPLQVSSLPGNQRAHRVGIGSQIGRASCRERV